MKYLVYMTICLVNQKQYIGVHMTNNPDKFDRYLGNGVYTNRPATYKKCKTPFQCAVSKYGIDNFKRTTIAVFDTKEEAFKLEAELVTLEYIKRPDTYNIKVGGSGGCPESLKVAVHMYDIEGNYVKSFESGRDAATYLKVKDRNGSHICRAIRMGYLFHGFQFSYEKLPCMKKYVKNQYTGVRVGNTTNHQCEKRPIGRYDSEGNLIETYACLRDCRNAGYINAKKVLTGERNTCQGFTFKYLE